MHKRTEGYLTPAPPAQPHQAVEASIRFDAEGYVFIRVQPNEIMQIPLNYVPAPLNGMRFLSSKLD